ncbi:MAG: winged helix-turn-helix domain-containing protein [Anaerolineae bacterium]
MTERRGPLYTGKALRPSGAAIGGEGMTRSKQSHSGKKGPNRSQLKAGRLTLDLNNHRLLKGRTVSTLTPKEFALLRAFMSNGGEVLTRKYLMKEVWETDYMGDTRTLDVHICWVRRKIEDDPANPQYLTTVRGVGYQFRASN